MLQTGVETGLTRDAVDIARLVKKVLQLRNGKQAIKTKGIRVAEEGCSVFKVSSRLLAQPRVHPMYRTTTKRHIVGQSVRVHSLI